MPLYVYGLSAVAGIFAIITTVTAAILILRYVNFYYKVTLGHEN